LLDAIARVRTRPLTLLLLGEGPLAIRDPEITVHALGYVDHDRTKVLAYNAADVSVHPAPVDNLPNTVLEALACGTPVIGLPIGGVPEMVRPGKTGWLADAATAEALAAALAQALDDVVSGIDMRQSCRQVADDEYSQDLQASRYVHLFESCNA
jgi:glycosyltransferase involved in cell wall biosynthesis